MAVKNLGPLKYKIITATFANAVPVCDDWGQKMMLAR